MSAAEPVRHVPPSALTPGASTPGMQRSEAVATAALWGGLVRTAAGAVSGWHHHGTYESLIYVVAGDFRMESGLDGREVIEGRSGDFLFVPAGAVHRESNPGSAESLAVVVRSGQGEAVFNVEGPATG